MFQGYGFLGSRVCATAIPVLARAGVRAALDGDAGPHIVVAPASLLENWQRELARWCPGLKVVLYYGRERGDLRHELLAWRCAYLGNVSCCAAPAGTYVCTFSLRVTCCPCSGCLQRWPVLHQTALACRRRKLGGGRASEQNSSVDDVTALGDGDSEAEDSQTDSGSAYSGEDDGSRPDSTSAPNGTPVSAAVGAPHCACAWLRWADTRF